MDITKLYRSHWVAADGTRYATQNGPDGAVRYDLHPIVNIAEMRAYADLGDRLLPRDGLTSQWCARRVADCIERGDFAVRATVAELTDCIPRYRPQWRAPFIMLRNMWPGVDGKPVVACDDTSRP